MESSGEELVPAILKIIRIVLWQAAAGCLGAQDEFVAAPTLADLELLLVLPANRSVYL